MNCKDCELRKYYAKAFDIHFDKKDCGLKCPVTEGGKDEKEKKVTLSQNNKP